MRASERRHLRRTLRDRLWVCARCRSQEFMLYHDCVTCQYCGAVDLDPIKSCRH